MRLSMFLSLALLAIRVGTPAAAQPASLVRDLNTRTGSAPGSLSLQGFAGLGDRAVFSAASGPDRSEVTLWTSDGSGAGTLPLPNLCSAAPCTVPPLHLGEALGLAFYLGGATGSYSENFDLWRTDGTAAGTYSLFPGVGAEGMPVPFAGLNALGRLVFSGCGAEGCGLWSSDGTAAGTRRLLAGQFTDLVVAGRAVYCFGYRGREVALYRSDGTTGGTRKVRDLPREDIHWLLTAAGSRVFFMGGEYSGDLWTSDGTREGTLRVEHFFESGHDFFPRVTTYLKAAGESVVFVADRGQGVQLWRSDGSRAGTRQLTAFPRGFFLPSPRQIALVGDRIFFRADDGVTGPRLWQSQLTLTSTAPLSGCPGGCPNLLDATPFVTLGGLLYFGGRDPSRGAELWVSDGTGPGTRPVRDLCPGPCDAAPFDFQALGGALYAGVAFADHRALLRSDGTEAGTRELARLPDSDSPRLDLAPVGSRLLFAGSDAERGTQPWITDGTAAETHLLTRLPGPAPSADPLGLLTLGSALLFSADDGFERGLWASEGGSLVPLMPGGALDAEGPGRLTLAGSLAYFVGQPSPDGAPELWRSDGTAAGTFQLAAFPGRTVRRLATLRGRLAFLVASDDGSQPAFTLWTSDGSAAGTVQRVVLPESAVGVPYLLGTGEELLFPVERDVGAELFWSDGSAEGTRVIVPSDCLCSAYYSGAEPEPAVHLGAAAYFTKWDYGDDFAGPALWRTDGTPAGSGRVLPTPGGQTVPRLYFPERPFAFGRDLYFLADTPRVDANDRLVLFHLRDGRAERLGIAGAAPNEAGDPQFTPAGDRLFFRAYDHEHGYELWVTDGTKAGTSLVRDLVPGAASADPQGLVWSRGSLYFTAYDPAHGRELWRSDGTAAGTRLVQDIAPGPASSRPQTFTVAGDRLYFSADDGATGRELWSLPLPN